MLTIGVLLGMVWMAVYSDLIDWIPVWRVIVRSLLNTFVLFWATGLIYIWWRPRRLAAFYHRAERLVVVVAHLCLYAGLGYLAISAILTLFNNLK